MLRGPLRDHLGMRVLKEATFSPVKKSEVLHPELTDTPFE
jgi:hypothetical protein